VNVVCSADHTLLKLSGSSGSDFFDLDFEFEVLASKFVVQVDFDLVFID